MLDQDSESVSVIGFDLKGLSSIEEMTKYFVPKCFDLACAYGVVFQSDAEALGALSFVQPP